MDKSQMPADQRSCLEYATNDLWRYDLAADTWEYIKPDTSISEATGEPVGYPEVRYGHGSAMITISAGQDPEGVRRIYLYIFGGMGPRCAPLWLAALVVYSSMKRAV